MPLSPVRKGEIAVLLSAVLWSLFPVVTILSYATLTPLFSAAFSTLVAAAFFAAMLTLKKQWHHLMRSKAWTDMLLTTFFIAVCFYGLMFVGLRNTTAGNASILSLMEIFFSFAILSLLLRHETLHPRHLLGSLSMVAGAAIILLPEVSGWHSGDLLVIAATLFAPLGNKYAQRARLTVGAECIMFFRSVVGGLFLLVFAYAVEGTPSVADLRTSWPYLFLNGILLFGVCKILWIEGIHRIPITKAISLQSIRPFFTILIAFVLLDERPMAQQFLGLLPIVVGVYLLTKTERMAPVPVAA